MDSLPSTDGMPSGQVLIDMIKKQLVLDARDQDARRDAFLSLAVSIPPRPRARIRDALGPLLARARRIGSRRDSVWSSLPDDTRTNTITKSPHREGSSVIEDDHVSTGADDASSLARELERNVGVLATLLVLGCKCAPTQTTQSSTLFLLLYLCLFSCCTTYMVHTHTHTHTTHTP